MKDEPMLTTDRAGLEAAANSGNVDAMVALAKLIRSTAERVAQLKEALAWSEKAAEHGSKEGVMLAARFSMEIAEAYSANGLYGEDTFNTWIKTATYALDMMDDDSCDFNMAADLLCMGVLGKSFVLYIIDHPEDCIQQVGFIGAEQDHWGKPATLLKALCETNIAADSLNLEMLKEATRLFSSVLEDRKYVSSGVPKGGAVEQQIYGCAIKVYASILRDGIVMDENPAAADSLIKQALAVLTDERAKAALNS